MVEGGVFDVGVLEGPAPVWGAADGFGGVAFALWVDTKCR